MNTDTYIERNRQIALERYGDRLDKNRNIIGTDYYFDDCWRLRQRVAVKSGMLCPKCNGKTDVYNSRPQKDGTTKRGRKCTCCGFRFHTTEMVGEGERVKT